MQDIEDFKCILCKKPFLPPYALPYLLPCTHSLCTHCLQHSIAQHQTHIICPEDLESNSLAQIRTDTSSRRALERLVREHKNYNQNNQLLCIQSLSKNLETLLEQQQEQRKDFLQLIDQIFRNEMQRLTVAQSRIHQELDTPFKVVKDWKENLKAYLQTLKGVSRGTLSSQIHSQLAYYIDQGRRIKQELTSFQDINYQQMANSLIVCSSACLSSDFTIREWGNQTKPYSSKQAKPERTGTKQKIVSNYSTHQSAKNKQFESRESQIQKRVASEPLDSKKNLSQNDQNRMASFTSCTLKLSRKEKNAPLNQAPGPQQRELREEVLRELQMNGDSLEGNPLVYSPSPEISLNRLHSPIVEYDELLLTEKEQRKPWSLGNYNFLQECEIGASHVSRSIEIKKREPFNWQKQSSYYVRKMTEKKAEQAFTNTQVTSNGLELMNYSLQDVEMSLFLEKFNWSKIEVVKLVRTNLSDTQLNDLLNFAVYGRLQTLVVSGNCLSQRALDALMNYLQVGNCLKSVYLSKNCINCLKGHTRTKITQLRECGLNLYI